MLQATSHPKTPFRHEALLYAGDDGFLEGTLPFVRAGLEAGEPILVAVGVRRIDLMRAELGADAEDVAFADMAQLGANPARIIPAWFDFAGDPAQTGKAIRGIGEPIWASRSAAELVECQRHESLLNLAFADRPAFRLLCPYDTAALGEEVLEEACRSHPHLVEAGVERDSPDARDLEAVAAPFDVPLPAPPEGAAELSFGGATLAPMRHFVAHRATAAGLDPDRKGDFVLAVAELGANSLRHGGGQGVVRVWEEPDALVAEVADGGRIEDPLVGRRRPAAAQIGGWGMWLANQTCDLVQVRTFASGSIVRLHMRLG